MARAESPANDSDGLAWESPRFQDMIQRAQDGQQGLSELHIKSCCKDDGQRLVREDVTSPEWRVIQERLNRSLKGEPMRKDDMIDIEVHPLFAPERFFGKLPIDAVYNTLKPAFQLCTLVITDDVYLDWWVHVKYARLRQHPATGHGHLELNQADVPKNAKAIVKAEMVEFASELKLFWTSEKYGKPMTNQGTTCVFCPSTPGLAAMLGTEDHLK